MQKAYSIIFGQRSVGFQAKIEGILGHPTIALREEPISLLKNIKTVMFNLRLKIPNTRNTQLQETSAIL